MSALLLNCEGPSQILLGLDLLSIHHTKAHRLATPCEQRFVVSLASMNAFILPWLMVVLVFGWHLKVLNTEGTYPYILNFMALERFHLRIDWSVIVHIS